MFESDKLFSEFITDGNKASFDKDIDLYTYTLKVSDCSCEDSAVLETSLKEINTSCSISEKNNTYTLEFENSSDVWEEGFTSYLHKDLDSFIRVCLVHKEVPDKFCIANERLTDRTKNNSVLVKIKSLTNWTKLLNSIADHKPDNNVLVFFVHQQSGKSKVYEVSPFLTVEDLEILEIDCDESHFKHLQGSWNLQDAHEKDRQSVMLVSFSEVMGQIRPEDNPFKFFLSQTKKFHDRYRENYDIYVNRFSVDSQLREIDEQHLDFIGKLQDLVTSAQTKAFAIPGVMIAIGALAKMTNFLSVVAIFAGVIMIKVLIYKSNELLRENLVHFSDTVNRALGQYVKYRTEAEEVRTHAEDAKQKLTKQISEAQKRVNFLDSLADCMMVIGSIIIVCVLYSITQATK